MNLTFKKQEFLQDLKTLIAIKSINGDCGKVTQNAPLGEGINNAIEAFLSIGKRFGFKTKNLDGFCGYIEMGSGEEMIGIIVHTDTVATGDGWSYPPLECTVSENGVYGRGVIDNKGPALLALYAMKALSDSDAPLSKRVRLIIGGDEENGNWRCMAHYKETEEAPTIAFSPDADYPVVFGEKGLIRLKVWGNEENISSDFTFDGGSVINIVPDEAHAHINGEVLCAKGKAAHGSMPEKGENAILKLAEKICAIAPQSTFAKLCSLKDAAALGIDISDEESGHLTVNPSILHADAKECSLSYDIRYPITASGDKVIAAIKKAVSDKGLYCEIMFHENPLYVPKESHLVKTLSEIYKKRTHDSAPPVAIGGGTYAKAFKNCVAFGAMLPDEPETMHAPDEFWSYRSIQINFDIITEAITKL